MFSYLCYLSYLTISVFFYSEICTAQSNRDFFLSKKNNHQVINKSQAKIPAKKIFSPLPEQKKITIDPHIFLPTAQEIQKEKIKNFNAKIEIIKSKYNKKGEYPMSFCKSEELIPFLEKNKSFLISTSKGSEFYGINTKLSINNKTVSVPCDIQVLKENGSIIAYPYRSQYAEGAFKKVFLGINTSSMDLEVKQVIALKENDHGSKIEKEVNLSKELNGKRGISTKINIIKKDKKEWITSQEYLGDELCDKDINLASIEAKYRVTLDLLYGLDEIHKKKIIHHDIKPENILVLTKNGKYSAVISDFGLASKKNEIISKGRGTPSFIPPEEYRGDQLAYLDESKKDVWAMGLSLLSAFKKINLHKNLDLYTKKQKNNFQKSIQGIKNFHDVYQVFGLDCLSFQPVAISNGFAIGPSLERLACAMVNPDVKTRINSSEALGVLKKMCEAEKNKNPQLNLDCS